MLLLSAAIRLSASEQSELGGRSWLHAHNCYPEQGRYQDRLERALATGFPVAIEQDLVWAPAGDGSGRSVVSHGAPLDGTEPTLETHFFEALRPAMEQAVEQHQTNRWPMVVLHLDFKTNEPEHHRAVAELLGRHRHWLTTAERVSGDAIMPLRLGPLLVLTENGPGQEASFHERVTPGEALLLFGTVATARPPDEFTTNQRLEWAASLPPAALIPHGSTNYRRWVNFPWAVVETGGQQAAGDWTARDNQRLQAVVAQARALGLWTRFYTLNGHAPAEGQGWSDGYNFGSVASVRARWQAAIAAGVDLIATDQYELFSQTLPSGKRP